MAPRSVHIDPTSKGPPAIGSEALAGHHPNFQDGEAWTGSPAQLETGLVDLTRVLEFLGWFGPKASIRQPVVQMIGRCLTMQVVGSLDLLNNDARRHRHADVLAFVASRAVRHASALVWLEPAESEKLAIDAVIDSTVRRDAKRYRAIMDALAGFEQTRDENDGLSLLDRTIAAFVRNSTPTTYDAIVCAIRMLEPDEPVT